MPGRRVRVDVAFGARLVQAMLEKKVRPGELARQLGVSAGQVSRWRKGEMPGGLRFREIAAALTVSVDWLKTGAVGLEPEDKPIVPTVERKAVRDLREAEAAIQAQLKRDYTDQGKSPPAYLIVGWLKTLLEAGGATPPDGPPAAAGTAGGRRTPPAGATLPPGPPSLPP
jgi:transcriptional regulator with XRE-family HTH domain